MKKLIPCLALAAAALVAPGRAQAAFMVKVTSGMSTLTATDNGMGDFDPDLGEIVAFGPVGAWTFTLSGALSKPALGTATLPAMDLVISASKPVGSPAASITFEATDTDFTATTPLALTGGFNGNSTFLALTGGTYQTFYDNTNAPFGTGGGSSNVQMFSGFSFVSPPGVLMTVMGGTPFSMTQRLVLDAPAGNIAVTGDANIFAVPAPGGLVLLAAGLPGLAVAYLRRKKAARA